MGVVFALSCLRFAEARDNDEFARRASWSAPTGAEVRERIEGWFYQQPNAEQLAAEFNELWAGDQWTSSQALDRLGQTVALVDPRAEKLVQLCSRYRTGVTLPEFEILQDAAIPSWVRNNLRLIFGQWLADHHLYNEARDQLSELDVSDVVDPASLLFYQSVTYHRLLDKEKCLPTLARLMENEDQLPRRYAVLAKLMESDIRPLKEDSLDEVARLMDSIRVRLGHGRAGKRVRKEEDDVIAKLDKMIKKLEQQASQQQSSGGSQSGSNAPSQPMQDSMPGGQTGPGNVDAKKLGARTDWGDLPPKEREEALQKLSEDLPSHYRDVIEEYFIKLARDGVQ